jgi:hypothetical protein
MTHSVDAGESRLHGGGVTYVRDDPRMRFVRAGRPDVEHDDLMSSCEESVHDR